MNALEAPPGAARDALLAKTMVVIPAFNEREALPAVLTDLAQTLPELSAVVIDDGSEDGTADMARALGAPCVRLPFNMGIGAALRAGFRYAAEHGCERAVQFDGDGQHRADQVPRLLAALDDGAHLVVGSRFAPAEETPGELPDIDHADNGDAYKVSLLRRSAMAMLRLGVRALCGRRFSDTTSGFRAVSEPLLSAFAADYPVEYMESTESLVAACRAGYNVAEVPVTMQPRSGGTPSAGPARLAYHYVRLLVSLASGSHRSLAPAPR